MKKILIALAIVTIVIFAGRLFRIGPYIHDNSIVFTFYASGPDRLCTYNRVVSISFSGIDVKTRPYTCQ